MEVVELLTELGGVATRAALLERAGRAAVDRALVHGQIVRVARGRYALAGVDEALAVAHRLSGVLCLQSAALHWGWAVKHVPRQPQVCVDRRRRLSTQQQGQAEIHRFRLRGTDVVGGVTSPDRTLADCLRMLPVDVALVIADSALRSGIGPQRLSTLAEHIRGPGAVKARAVADAADGRAANPFESVLRFTCGRVRGLEVVPQVDIRRTLGAGLTVWVGRPDLVDLRLRIVIEAESFEWHGDKASLEKDAKRFNQLAIDGWLVLRFTWVEVMFHPDQVVAVLEAAVVQQTNRLCPTCRSAS